MELVNSAENQIIPEYVHTKHCLNNNTKPNELVHIAHTRPDTNPSIVIILPKQIPAIRIRNFLLQDCELAIDLPSNYVHLASHVR